MDEVGEIFDKPLLQVDLLLQLRGVECDFQERNPIITVPSMVGGGCQCLREGSGQRRVVNDVGEVNGGMVVVSIFLWALSFEDPVWSCSRDDPCMECYSTVCFLLSWKVLIMALWICVTLLDVKRISSVA